MNNNRLPPLNSLKAFEAAARHESFLEAAAEQDVTSDRCRATSQCAGGLIGKAVVAGAGARRRHYGNGRIDRIPDASRPEAPDAAAGKRIPRRPKGTARPDRLATTGRERSTGGPAPIGAPWPSDRGCNGFRRGAGDLQSGQAFDRSSPAHSCRSHSFNRTRVRLFADEAFMIR